MSERNKLTMEQRRKLEHIAELGANNAADTLSKFTAQDFTVSSPRVSLLPIKRIFELVEDEDEIVSFSVMEFNGEISGAIALVLSPKSVINLLKIVDDEEINSMDDLTEMSFSVLKETGNIILGAFINAISNFFHTAILPDVPDVAVENYASILDSFSTIIYGDKFDSLLLFETVLATKKSEKNIDAFLLFFLESMIY